MSYYGQYGKGLSAFVREWRLDRVADATLDPVVLEALQSFLDIVSPERGYRLSFVPSGTAATSFSTKRVVVTSEALRGVHVRDDSTSYWASDKRALGQMTGQRFAITAGMICHEVSHIRYGQDTAGAVERAYPKGHKQRSLALAVSNVLDDARIEAAFAWDFPGFGKKAFDAVLAWVVRKEAGSSRRQPCPPVKNRADALQVAVVAGRYSQYYYQPNVADADATKVWNFAQKWITKYTADDSISLHLAGVAAMIEFLKGFPKPAEETPPPTPPCDFPQPPSDEDDEGEDESEDEDGGMSADPSGIDFDLDDEDEDEDDGPSAPAPGEGNEDEDEDDDEDGESFFDGDDEDDERDPDDDQDDWDEQGNPRDEEEDDESDDESDRYGDDDEDDDEDPEEGTETESLDDIEPVEDDEDEPVLSDDQIKDALDGTPDIDKAIDSAGDSNDKRMNNSLDKVLTERDQYYDEAGDATVRVNRNPRPRKGNPRWNPVGKADLAVAQEVRLAFENTRYSHDEWAGYKGTGRFRSRDASRAASGALDVFSRRESESSTRVHLALLLDYSGSMSGGCFTEATRVAATINEAMGGSPVFRQSVWQYLSSPRGTDLNRLWATGDARDIEQAMKDGGDPDSGTPTGAAVFGLVQEMLADRRADEALVLLSITDGDPHDTATLRRAVAQYGDRVAVVGVYVDDARIPAFYSDEQKATYKETQLDPARKRQVEKMRKQYGDERVIAFDGNWSHLAEDIAEVVGRAIAGTLDKR